MDFFSVIIYISYATLSVSTAYIAQRNKSKAFVILSYLICISFWGLRKDIGFDYEGYVNIFKDIQYNGTSYVEYGYYCLNKIFSSVTEGQVFVLFFSTAITFGFLFIALIRYKILWQGLLYSLVFQYQFMAANQVRQGMAIAVFFSFMYLLGEKKYIKYAICVVLTAALIHTSAVFLLLAIPCSFVRIGKYKACIILTVIYLFYLLGLWTNLGFILFSQLPIPEAYTHYLLTDRVFNEEIGFSIVQLFNILISYYIIWNKNVLPQYIFMVFFLGILMYIVFIEYHLFFRISTYFLYANIICIALINKAYPDNTKIINIVSAIFYVLICCQASNMHGIIPYKTLL